jgi:hypothetical protein
MVPHIEHSHQNIGSGGSPARLTMCFAVIRTIFRCARRPAKDLDETYERTLRDIDNQKRKYAKRLFQCLSVSIRPLRVEDSQTILSVQFDATSPRSSNEAFPATECRMGGVVRMLLSDHHRQSGRQPSSPIRAFFCQGILDIGAARKCRRTSFILSHPP